MIFLCALFVFLIFLCVDFHDPHDQQFLDQFLDQSLDVSIQWNWPTRWMVKISNWSFEPAQIWRFHLWKNWKNCPKLYGTRWRVWTWVHWLAVILWGKLPPGVFENVFAMKCWVWWLTTTRFIICLPVVFVFVFVFVLLLFLLFCFCFCCSVVLFHVLSCFCSFLFLFFLVSVRS